MFCICTNFGRAEAELAWRKLWVTAEPLEISSAQDWVTQLPSSELEWAKMDRTALWTDAPSIQISCDTKEKFHAGMKCFQSWCSALCFVSRGENSLGFILPDEWELPQPGVPVWHRERPEMTIHLLMFPNSTCTSFCEHPKGKIKTSEELKTDFYHQSFHLCLY